MKFTAVAIIALATGAFAIPSRQGPPPKPNKPSPPIIKDNNNNNQNNVCGNGQSLYCCNNEGGKSNNVICASLSNGGLGGVCNGIQVCCNSNVSALIISCLLFILLTSEYRTATRAATLATVVAPSSSRTRVDTASSRELEQSTPQSITTAFSSTYEELGKYSIDTHKTLTLLTMDNMNAFTRDEIGTGFGRRFASVGL